jgi:hypothetical protein
VILTEIILAGGIALGAATALVLADSIKVNLWSNSAVLQTRWPQFRYAGGTGAGERGSLQSRSDDSLNGQVLVSGQTQAPTTALQLSGLDLLDIFVFHAFMFVMTAEYAIAARGELGRAWADLPLMDRLPVLISLIEQLRHWITVISLLSTFG